MAEFRMPSLGADMEAGTLRKWLRAPGDAVSRGDIIAEVETEKGIVEVEVFADGTVERILVAPGTRVPVGTPLALIRQPGEQAAPVPASPPPPPPPVAAAPAEKRPRVSPAAKIRAQDLGVDLARVKGTGPEGAVTVADVERCVLPGGAAPPVAPSAPPPDARAAMRRTIAAAMARSKREIPHYYLSSEIDLGPAMGWLKIENERRRPAERLLPGVLFVKAVALALRRAPELNARWSGDRAEPAEHIHPGVAIALRGGGLVAPALHDADRMEITALMAAFRDLVERTRAGLLRSSELSDGTMTVTSLGELGADSVLPVIYPPQVAIVGFGRIVDRVRAVAGAPVVRPVVTCTLAADHRVSDGIRGSVFLTTVESLLAEPEKL